MVFRSIDSMMHLVEVLEGWKRFGLLPRGSCSYIYDLAFKYGNMNRDVPRACYPKVQVVTYWGSSLAADRLAARRIARKDCMSFGTCTLACTGLHVFLELSGKRAVVAVSASGFWTADLSHDLGHQVSQRPSTALHVCWERLTGNLPREGHCCKIDDFSPKTFTSTIIKLRHMHCQAKY